MRSSLILHTSLALLAVASLLAVRELSLLPDGSLRIAFLDVGQGSSTLIRTPTGKRVLVDGGPDGRTLEHLGVFLPFFDRRIDLLVLTHPEEDHLGRLQDVVERYDVRNVLLTGIDRDSGTYQALLTRVEEKHIPVLLPDPDRDIDLGDGVSLDILWPLPGLFGERSDASNSTSVVARVLFHGSGVVLLPGDIERSTEEAILASGDELQSSVLAVPHHGSLTSSSTGFLLAVKPDLAVISVGAGNTFGHPHPAIVDRYRALRIPVRTTMGEGTIEVSF